MLTETTFNSIEPLSFTCTNLPAWLSATVPESEEGIQNDLSYFLAFL